MTDNKDDNNNNNNNTSENDTIDPNNITLAGQDTSEEIESPNSKSVPSKNTETEAKALATIPDPDAHQSTIQNDGVNTTEAPLQSQDEAVKPSRRLSTAAGRSKVQDELAMLRKSGLAKTHRERLRSTNNNKNNQIALSRSEMAAIISSRKAGKQLSNKIKQMAATAKASNNPADLESWYMKQRAAIVAERKKKMEAEEHLRRYRSTDVQKKSSARKDIATRKWKGSIDARSYDYKSLSKAKRSGQKSVAMDDTSHAGSISLLTGSLYTGDYSDLDTLGTETLYEMELNLLDDVMDKSFDLKSIPHAGSVSSKVFAYTQNLNAAESRESEIFPIMEIAVEQSKDNIAASELPEERKDDSLSISSPVLSVNQTPLKTNRKCPSLENSTLKSNDEKSTLSFKTIPTVEEEIIPTKEPVKSEAKVESDVSAKSSVSKAKSLESSKAESISKENAIESKDQIVHEKDKSEIQNHSVESSFNVPDRPTTPSRSISSYVHPKPEPDMEFEPEPEPESESVLPVVFSKFCKLMSFGMHRPVYKEEYEYDYNQFNSPKGYTLMNDTSTSHSTQNTVASSISSRTKERNTPTPVPGTIRKKYTNVNNSNATEDKSKNVKPKFNTLETSAPTKLSEQRSIQENDMTSSVKQETNADNKVEPVLSKTKLQPKPIVTNDAKQANVNEETPKTQSDEKEEQIKSQETIENKKPPTIWRNFIKSGSNFKFQPEPKRYHMYVSMACPWAHRVLLVRALKGLDEAIPVTSVHPIWKRTKPDDDHDQHRGWVFADPDSDEPFTNTEGVGSFPAYYRGNKKDLVNNCTSIRELYELAGDTSGKYTVPLLWDTKHKTIVSNESSDLIKMLNKEFNAFAKNPEVDLFPESCKKNISLASKWLYPRFNNGVYRCGLATSQKMYLEAVKDVVWAFDKIEKILKKQRYISGNTLTEADIRLFPTLLRFDEVYNIYFKINCRMVAHSSSILNYCREIYQMPRIRDTCDMNQIKAHYFCSHVELNKYSIIPIGTNFIHMLEQPHDRDRLFPHINMR